MTLQFNNPDLVSERSNVVPLSLEEEKRAIEAINEVFPLLFLEEQTLIQRMIWRYENMKHKEAVNSGKAPADFWDQNVTP